ncbi:MAG: RNA polymerase sigma factor [candidate division Zixibacteria bacterium]|nr:RNA polymerase sigma factor [candidate division Zixibacteria bacterium]
MDDLALVRKFLTSRSEADFRLLYRQHSPALYQFLLRRLGADENLANETLQNVWVRAVEKLSSFRLESTFKSWLFGVAVNVCRESYRKCSGVITVDDIDVEEIAAPSRGLDQIELIDLERAITKLPDGYREILILHDLEGFTHAEIAKHKDIDIGTSKSQLSRARRTLRRFLTTD